MYSGTFLSYPPMYLILKIKRKNCVCISSMPGVSYCPAWQKLVASLCERKLSSLNYYQWISSKQMVRLKCDDLTIEGNSVSGVSTYLRIGELDPIFDLGRCPISFIGTNHVFISHFHLDHYFGLPIYISQRWMAKIAPGQIFVPADGVEQLSQILNHQKNQFQ